MNDGTNITTDAQKEKTESVLPAQNSGESQQQEPQVTQERTPPPSPPPADPPTSVFTVPPTVNTNAVGTEQFSQTTVIPQTPHNTPDTEKKIPILFIIISLLVGVSLIVMGFFVYENYQLKQELSQNSKFLR